MQLSTNRNASGRTSLGPTALVLGAGVLWGVISLFVRALSAAGLSSPQISAVRLIVGVIGVGALLLATDRSKLKIRPRDIWIFIGTGVVSLTFFNICYFTCMQMSEASIAVVLLYTSPVWVMIMSAVFFRERITARKVVAIVLTLAGSVLVAGLLGGAVQLTPLALGVGLLSGIFYAAYSIFGRVALERYDTYTVTFWTFLTGAVFSLFISDIGGVVATIAATPGTVLPALGIGILCTIAPYLLYTQGLKNMEPSRAAILAMAEPVVGAVLGIVAYGESAGPLKIVGIVLIFASIILLSLNGDEPSTDSPS